MAESIPYLLDARLIRCFLTVLDLRNVTLAAEALAQTQSATSKNILKLEDELGVPLFERVATGMVPTVYGLALVRYARQIDLESRHARAEISVLRTGGHGVLTIGIGPTWSVHVLPEAIARFQRAKPGARVRTRTGVPDTLVPDLMKGNLDLICTTMDFPEHPMIEKVPLFEVEFVVIARSDHPLLTLPQVGPTDLKKFAWVGFTDGQITNQRISQFFVTNGVEPPGWSVEASSLGSVLSLIQTGEFIAALSSTVLPHAKELGLKRVPVDASFWRFKAGVAYQRDNPHPMIVDFVQQMQLVCSASISEQTGPTPKHA